VYGDDTERREWIIGILVTAVVIGGLYWMRSQRLEEKTTAAQTAVHQPQSMSQAEAQPPSGPEEYVIETHAHSPKTIARVYECKQDGQLVLRDQPCGPNAAVREIAAPNRMVAQDTSVLYEPPPRAIQVQRQRAARQVPPAVANKATCDEIDEEKKRINEIMRKPYHHKTGEYYRERLRELNELRWNLHCGRSNEIP
jgi:hypothetical protein